MKRLLVLAAAAGALVLGAATGDAAPRIDFAGVALNVLPPGQTGELGVGRHSVDQIALYDGLTPLGGNITQRDLTRYYKSARFGVEGKPERTTRPRAGLRIVRDRWGVPHVYGRTRADVEFGAGWVTAEDRGLLLQLLRPAGRIAALDVPGIDAFSFALSGRGFQPSAQAEQQLASTIGLLQATRDGRQLLADVRAFVAGINAYHAANRLPIEPWTLNDVAAMGALIGAVFGAGGGDETRRAMFLEALRHALGDERGRVVFDDLRDRNDPETPTTIAKAFPWEDGARTGVGNATVDDGYSYLYTGEYEMPEFDLGNTFNYAEMAALIAPKPFMVERGHFDGVAPDEWVAYEFAKVRRLYAQLGVPGKTAIEFFNGPHKINGVATYDFLHEHLQWPKR